MAKYRKVQHELEEAEERADTAENAMSKMRARNRNSASATRTTTNTVSYKHQHSFVALLLGRDTTLAHNILAIN